MPSDDPATGQRLIEAVQAKLREYSTVRVYILGRERPVVASQAEHDGNLATLISSGGDEHIVALSAITGIDVTRPSRLYLGLDDEDDDLAP